MVFYRRQLVIIGGEGYENKKGQKNNVLGYGIPNGRRNYANGMDGQSG